MASLRKQRKLLLEDPSLFTDDEIIQMVQNNVANLYEISKTGGLGPYRKRRLEDKLYNRVPSQSSASQVSPNTKTSPVHSAGPTIQPESPISPQRPEKNRFPVPRQEVRPIRKTPVPPPLPSHLITQSPSGPPTGKPGPRGPFNGNSSNNGNRY